MKFQFETAPKPPQISLWEWNSWTWQMRNGLSSAQEFSQAVHLQPTEQEAFARNENAEKKLFQVRSTPYYLSLIRPEDAQDPLRKIILPQVQEWNVGTQAQLDPLGERKHNPVQRLIHRYPDRVLFLVTDTCSVYCRYCTRKHFTGQEQAFLSESEYQNAISYLRAHTGIREVILSGGDPLTLSDDRLERVLNDLRTIEHIEIIRVGSRMPVVCPMRITDRLVSIFRKAKPVYLMTHFNHPRELTKEAAEALEKVVDSGTPIFNQMVLLRGVNNHPAIVQALSRRLLYLRVKPYYMFQCDPSEGTDHLRTSLEESEAIQRELWGKLSGLAMPNLSVDIPSGGGKVGLTPDYEISRNAEGRTYRGWDGVTEIYRNPPVSTAALPSDIGEYAKEWESLQGATTLIRTMSNNANSTLGTI